MNDSIRKTILLHLNTEDVEKKMSSWKTELADIRSALSYCAERFFLESFEGLRNNSHLCGVNSIKDCSYEKGYGCKMETF